MAVGKTSRPTWKVFFGITISLKNRGTSCNIDSKNQKINLTTTYYFNNGFFNVITDYKVDTVAPKRAKIKYEISTGKPYF
jgi:hypothetical protein